MVVNGSQAQTSAFLFYVLLHHHNEFIRTWRCYGVVNGRDDVSLGFTGLIDEPRAGERFDGEFKTNDLGCWRTFVDLDAILFASGMNPPSSLGRTVKITGRGMLSLSDWMDSSTSRSSIERSRAIITTLAASKFSRGLKRCENDPACTLVTLTTGRLCTTAFGRSWTTPLTSTLQGSTTPSKSSFIPTTPSRYGITAVGFPSTSTRNSAFQLPRSS